MSELSQIQIWNVKEVWDIESEGGTGKTARNYSSCTSKSRKKAKLLRADGFDHMPIEYDEGNEEVEYIDLIPVPDLDDISEDRIEKPKTHSKITSFFTAR